MSATSTTRNVDRARDILRDAYAFSGPRLWLLIVLLFAAGATDGISMALLYPVLELVGLGPASASATEQGNVSRAFHWLFNSLGLEPTLANASFVLVVAVLVQVSLFTTQNWLLLDIQKKYIAAWQRRLFDDFIAAEWPYFVQQKTGELLNLLQTETLRLGSAFFSILQLMISTVVLGVYLMLSLFVSWKLTLYLLVAGAVMFFVVQPIRRATRRFGAEFGIISAEVSTTLNEMLAGAKFIKASGGEAKADAVVGERLDRFRHNITWSAFLPTTIRSCFEFAGILMILGALFYGLKIEQVSPAQLLVLIALVARLFPRLMQIQQFNNNLNLSGPAYTVLEEAHARFAAHREKSDVGKLTDVASLLPADIRAQDLVMRYGDKTVLDRVSLTIPAGKVVGLVGPSGAGKSTLLDIVMGLVEPSGGRIVVGQRPLPDIDMNAWRKAIGYVSQDTFLFHDTVANNIRWSAPDASMEAVRAAARAAGIDQFVSSLPLGYETIVGDRGAKLSGGQRQRISIARALVRQPALLILDEATSALDSLLEKEVMSVIHGLSGMMTIIIVAHRLATVREADIIYVLDHGKIVEEGSWDALSGQKTLFRRLMQAQAVAGAG
jgi:ATP-binding cassette subfamily C protein